METARNTARNAQSIEQRRMLAVGARPGKPSDILRRPAQPTNVLPGPVPLETWRTVNVMYQHGLLAVLDRTLAIVHPAVDIASPVEGSGAGVLAAEAAEVSGAGAADGGPMFRSRTTSSFSGISTMVSHSIDLSTMARGRHTWA